MKVGNLPPLPNLPTKVPSEVEVAFVGPKTVKTLLGRMPEDVSGAPRGDLYFPHSSRQAVGGDQEIWREQPVLDAQGAPVMEAQVARLNVETVSKLGSTLSGAVVGGFLGGAAGFALGCSGLFAGSLGQAAPMVVAPLVGALVGGGLGHRSASDDRVRLEWREQPIETLKFTSFSGHHNVRTGGYSYTPEFEATKLGTYWKPEVVHYSARTGKEHYPFTNDCGPL